MPLAELGIPAGPLFTPLTAFLRSSSEGAEARVEGELVFGFDESVDVAERDDADPGVLLSPIELPIEVFDPEADANGVDTEPTLGGCGIDKGSCCCCWAIGGGGCGRVCMTDWNCMCDSCEKSMFCMLGTGLNFAVAGEMRTERRQSQTSVMTRKNA